MSRDYGRTCESTLRVPRAHEPCRRAGREAGARARQGRARAREGARVGARPRHAAEARDGARLRRARHGVGARG
jgi:hypothetical protein